MPSSAPTRLMAVMMTAKDSVGNTPLHRAAATASYRATAVILLVLPMGPMMRNLYTVTPFDICMSHLNRNDHRAVLLPLLLPLWPHRVRTPSRNGNSILHDLVTSMHCVAAIRCAYELFPEAIRMKNISSFTPVHLAVAKGNAIALTFLLSVWPDGVKEYDNRGWLPIHAAMSSCDMGAMTLLLRACPDSAMWPTQKCGWTPEHYACRNSTRMAKSMLSLVPPEALSLRTKEGRTAFHEAVSNDSSSTTILNMMKLDPNAIKATETGTDETVFHMAARQALIGMTRRLIDLWPEGLMQRNAEGKTPFQINRNAENTSTMLLATETSRRRMALLLQGDDAGSMLQRRTEDGNTAVHIATQRRNTEALQLLLELWPEAAHVENYAKKTPLDLATTFVELRVLCQYGAPAPVSTIMSTRRSKGLRDAKIDAIRALVQPSTGPEERKEAVRVLRLPWGPKDPSFSISATMWKKIIHAAQRPLGTPTSLPWDHFPWAASHPPCS